MEQQIVEVRFEGEQLATHKESSTTTYTLYRVPGGAYVVYVQEGDQAWLETSGGKGLNEGMVRTFFPQLARAAGLG